MYLLNAQHFGWALNELSGQISYARTTRSRRRRQALLADAPEMLLLERAEGSLQPVDVAEKHFQTDEAFDDVSYAVRCENSIRRLVREQLVTGACFVLSPRREGLDGVYTQPAVEMSFAGFIASLQHHVNVHT